MTTQPLPPRADIPEDQTWNVASIFPNIEAWKKAFAEMEITLQETEKYQGKLGSSPKVLLEWLELSERIKQRMYHLYFYASLNYAVDTTNQEYAALTGMVGGLVARCMAALAFTEPEIMAIDFDTLKNWVKTGPGLDIYAHYFHNLERQAAHIRSGEVEALLGQVGDPFQAASETHNILAVADLTFKPALDSAGNEHEVSHSNLDVLLSSRDRELRKNAFESYADAHLAFRNTMASCLSAGYRQDVFLSRAHLFNNSLEAALATSFLPVEVYHNVISTYRKNLPIWHRYWEVCRKALKLDTMHVYDTRVDLIENMPKVSYEQVSDWVVDGLRILGDDYAETVRRGIKELRWVDYHPNKGKRFGAFSAGYAGTQPFIMMSFDGTLGSLGTLAHELGHSMHSLLTWQNQPLVYSDYSLFVAEVASNFHQAIVRAHLFETVKDPAFQIGMIDEAMANFHRYFFIMPSLAIFDLEAHQQIEKGGALTAEYLTNLMADIFQEGYGPNVVIDRERVGSVWMQFSTHLYSNYYTYQYTTGISAAHALAEPILAGDTAARDRYLSMLKAGASMDPLDALKMAGVDMTTPEPVEKTFKVLEKLIDRLEKLVVNE
ncbi:MAG: oligoendopeptidase F [Chloroflexi bacterium]|nr:oligoendopeptidase F [Chloroflexota bacterium]